MAGESDEWTSDGLIAEGSVPDAVSFADLLARVTARLRPIERWVLEALPMGYEEAEIAQHLKITRQAVAKHRKKSLPPCTSSPHNPYRPFRLRLVLLDFPTAKLPFVIRHSHRRWQSQTEELVRAKVSHSDRDSLIRILLTYQPRPRSRFTHHARVLHSALTKEDHASRISRFNHSTHLTI
jgi:hypothetical protein